MRAKIVSKNIIKKVISGSLAFTLVITSQFIGLGDIAAEPLRSEAYVEIKHSKGMNPFPDIDVEASTTRKSLNMPANKNILSGYTGANAKNITFTTDNQAIYIDNTNGSINNNATLPPSSSHADGYDSTEGSDGAAGAMGEAGGTGESGAGGSSGGRAPAGSDGVVGDGDTDVGNELSELLDLDENQEKDGLSDSADTTTPADDVNIGEDTDVGEDTDNGDVTDDIEIMDDSEDMGDIEDMDDIEGIDDIEDMDAWANMDDIEDIDAWEEMRVKFIRSVQYGNKNAFVNNAATPQNGAAFNPAPVKINDVIRYEITTVNEKYSGKLGAKYDVLFVLDWSESMNGLMMPGQSARLYERDVALDLSDYLMDKYPNSRVAVMGMNSDPGLTNNVVNTRIQFESDFLNIKEYRDWGRAEISRAFDAPPQNRTEDLASFLRAANFKMEKTAVSFGNSSVGGAKQTIPRSGNDLHERIPVIIFISDFQIPKGQDKGDYWGYSMKSQADRFDNMHEYSIMHTVRFDHGGNHTGGNADYATAAYNKLMTENVSPGGRGHWTFTRVDRNTSYTEALSAIKEDFMRKAPPGVDLGTIVTDTVPEGLEVDIGSVSHGGVYDAATRTITWDLQSQNEGAITVRFNATVMQAPKDFVNVADVAFYDGAKISTNLTYHRAEKITDANIIISKTVTGNLGDVTKRFEFAVYLIDEKESNVNVEKKFQYHGGVIYGSGAVAPGNGVLTLSTDGLNRAVFHLSHGQAISISDVPADIKVMVVETRDDNYNISHFDSKDNVEVKLSYSAIDTLGDKDRSFDFINARKETPPMGIDYGTRTRTAAPLLALLFVLPAAAFIKSRVNNLIPKNANK